jgi:hypothetical protein
MRYTPFATLFGFLVLVVSSALAQTTTPPARPPVPRPPQVPEQVLARVGLRTGGGLSWLFWSWLPRSGIS